jgi:RNA polymerase-binding transcription factor DksA
MNNEDLIIKNKILEEENKKLQDELMQTKEHLKKYTAPSRNKKYYENHKEELLEKMKTTPIPSDKRKEYNKNYYLKNIKKDKLGNI